MLDVLQIGASRAASTWLWRCLSLHPEINFPVPGKNAPDGRKSGWFWNNNSKYWGDDGHYGKIRHSINEINTLDEYRKWFDPIEVGQLNVDITEGAAYIPPVRIDIIKDVYPNVNILYCIRNPITTFWSHTQFHHLSIDQAVKAHGGNLVRNVQYLKNYNNWADSFGEENIYPYFFNRVEANPRWVLHMICIHLNIDPLFWYTIPYDVLTIRHNARKEAKPIPGPELVKLRKLFEQGIWELKEEWEHVPAKHWLNGKE